VADDLLDAAAELRARHWQSLDTGETGPAGAGIVARARSTGPLTPATALVFEEVPLTGNSWVQAADEMNTAG